jgi:ATP-dependent Clp protease protease subunit
MTLRAIPAFGGVMSDKELQENEGRTIDADTLKEVHEYSIDLDTDVIYLEAPEGSEDIDGVTWHMARKFQKNIRVMVAEDAEKVSIDINTPGGDCLAGMAIYDAIKMCPVKVTGIVTAEASSMGCIILQACDDRVIYPNALVMWHPGHEEMHSAAPEFKSYFKWNEKAGEKMNRIVYERVLAKQPDLTYEAFEIAVMRGIYLNAEEAVAYGLADRVAEYPKKA